MSAFLQQQLVVDQVEVILPLGVRDEAWDDKLIWPGFITCVSPDTDGPLAVQPSNGSFDLAHKGSAILRVCVVLEDDVRGFKRLLLPQRRDCSLRNDKTQEDSAFLVDDGLDRECISGRQVVCWYTLRKWYAIGWPAANPSCRGCKLARAETDT